MKIQFKKDVDFFGSGLSFFCSTVANEMHTIREFHTRTEQLWNEENIKLQSTLETIQKNYNQIHHSEIAEDFSLDFSRNQEFSEIHRKSVTVAIHNVIEHRLNELCILIQNMITSEIKLEDLNGKGIERASL